MPLDPWSDAGRLAACGLITAAAAVPVGLAAWFISKRDHQPLFPTARRWSAPWSGLEVLILFIASMPGPLFIDKALDACGFFQAVYGRAADPESWAPMRSLWAYAFFAPLFVTLMWWVLKQAYPDWGKNGAAPAAQIAGGVGAWLAIHPVVAVTHFAVTAVFLSQGWTPETHPLQTKFSEGRPPVDNVLFVVQAAIAAPLLEEFLFRRTLLPWLLGGRNRPAITMAFATLLAVAHSFQESGYRAGPTIFAGILLATGFILHVVLKQHRRTVAAIFASAALFAVVHSPVWPTPIPLFVLGLGLGWLAVRTRGILACVIVHGLLNFVSVLFVLRG